MRTLLVSPRQCWPALSGAKLREFHLARALGAAGPVHYAFFQSPDGAPAAANLPFCAELRPAPAARRYTADQLLRGVVSRWPLPVLHYTTAAMRQTLRDATAAAHFDIVQLESIHMAAYEAELRQRQPQARVVYNWHNIESDILRQYAGRGPSWPRRQYAALTARKMQALEQRILHTAHGHLVCSERERQRLLQWQPQARIAVIENGVDTARFPAAPAGWERRHRLLFVGILSYHANVEAALWFTLQLWPRLRQQFPRHTLTLVGAEPVEAVRALAREERVEVTGTVPDVAPYYQQAAAALVPLRTGGGTRLKILEAMAAGVPVISTPLGAEGLEITPGENIVLAPEQDGPDLAAAWQQALEEVLGAEARWRALSAAGRRLVASRYDWSALGARLVEVYREWLR